MPCTAPSLRYYTGLVRFALTERFWLVLLWALTRPHDRAQQPWGFPRVTALLCRALHRRHEQQPARGDKPRLLRVKQRGERETGAARRHWWQQHLSHGACHHTHGIYLTPRTLCSH